MEKLLRDTSTSAAAAAAAAAGDLQEKDECVSETRQKLSTLQQKWNMLWRLSGDMKKKLQDNFANLLQVGTYYR